MQQQASLGKKQTVLNMHLDDLNTKRKLQVPYPELLPCGVIMQAKPKCDVHGISALLPRSQPLSPISGEYDPDM
jgi:hypothetical protein